MKRELMDAVVAGVSFFLARTAVALLASVVGLNVCGVVGIVLVGYATVNIYSYLRAK